MKKQILILILIAFFFLPNVVFAAWWNPVSWSFWPWNHRKDIVQEEVKLNPPSSTKTATSTATPSKPPATNFSDNNYQQNKPQVAESQISPISSKKNSISELVPVSNSSNYSWEELEIRYLVEADFKGWTNISITNPSSGQIKYYIKEGEQWIRKESEIMMMTEVKIKKNKDTFNELENNCRDALQDSNSRLYHLHTLLGKQDHFERMSEVSNEESYQFLLIDECVSKKIIVTDALIGDVQLIQKTNLTPDENIKYTQLLNTLLQNRQQLERIQKQIDLAFSQHSSQSTYFETQNPISLPSIIFPSLPPIQARVQGKWQIRWEGNGVGSIITPGGEQRFHCEKSGCQSY